MDGGKPKSSLLSASDGKSYCNLSRNEAIQFLTSSNFKTNNNAFVKFDTKYNYSNGNQEPSKFIMSGGGYRLEGDWTISTNGQVYISNYRVVSGNVDASNNSKSRGSLNLECNGNLRGFLVDRNGNSVDLKIKKS